METLENEQDCFYEMNFQESLKQQQTIEEYLLATGNPIHIGETAVQEQLVFPSEEDTEE